MISMLPDHTEHTIADKTSSGNPLLALYYAGFTLAFPEMFYLP